jgi:hypothetical protein
MDREPDERHRREPHLQSRENGDRSPWHALGGIDVREVAAVEEIFNVDLGGQWGEGEATIRISVRGCHDAA